MGIIEQPHVQRNILVTNPQPTIEIELTFAYCQHVGHEFKNCPFANDKLKQLMREELKTSLPLAMTNTLAIQVGVPMPQILSQSGLVIHPTMVN
jgi:hypothetical protein